MKPITITITPPFSWKKRCAIFLGIFGGLWLFIEPLSAFGLARDVLESSGGFGYAVLLIFSFITTFLIEFLESRKNLGQISFTKLTILLTENGTEHMVNVPRSMRVGQFLSIFVAKIQLNAMMIPVDAYELSLNVYRNGSYQKINSENTIQEANLNDNDLCKITGEILPRHQTLALTVDYRRPWHQIAHAIESRYKIVGLAERFSEKLFGRNKE